MVADLPSRIQVALLRRWREPHRDYHGEPHLRAGLQALELLGGTRIERIAYWFHDAVHSNTSPRDEHESIVVAENMLAGHLTAGEVNEVTRLIRVTINHDPQPSDEAGCRISDADLAGLALDWSGYVANRDGIRAELPHEGDSAWRARRHRMVTKLLAAAPIFRTEFGRATWETRARENLERELTELRH